MIMITVQKLIWSFLLRLFQFEFIIYIEIVENTNKKSCGVNKNLDLKKIRNMCNNNKCYIN